jgi:uncharacterized GH25 family protein
MKAHTVKKLALVLALAGAALSAQAHRPWMLPTQTFIESDRETWVTIDGAVSEGLFDVDHMPLRLDGLTVINPDGTSSPAPAPTVGKHRSTVDIQLPKDGTYRITLAAANVMGSYQLNGETKRFRATEQTVQKEVPAGATEVKTSTTQQRQDTFVTLNKPSTGALKPTGVGLEMVPLTHPNALHAGEKATVRFLLDGKPLANFPFSMIPGGVKYRGTANEVRLSTDAKGEASFALPAPNMYWLSAAYPANAPRGPGAEAPAKRYSYSATLEILPE